MTLRKAKVIHLVSDLGIGGAQKVVLDICSSADLDKYDVSVYSLSEETDLLSAYKLPSAITIKILPIEADEDYSPQAYLRRAIRPSVSTPYARSILDAALSDRPDILHVHLGPRELNLGLLIQELTGCKLLYTQHLVNFRKESFGAKLMGLIFRLTYRKYDLIAVSEPVRDEILNHKLTGRNRKLFLIENKLNLERFIPSPKRTAEKISVVYVARMAPVKGHRDLINAWALLRDHPTPKRLILVGPDSMNDQIQSLAQELGLMDTIEFAGPAHNVTELLNEADIGVFPSHLEGLPIALLEKMAMRLPTVVSDITELTAIITDKVNGLVFKCGDASDLASKLSSLIDDSALRHTLGKNARQTVEVRFGSSNIALANERVYERLLLSRAV